MTTPLDDSEELARRIRAAIALAGINGVPELARRLDTPGLGQDTLYAALAGRRHIGRHEVREIAAICGVPFEFFTEDLGALSHVRDMGLELAQLRGIAELREQEVLTAARQREEKQRAEAEKRAAELNNIVRNQQEILAKLELLGSSVESIGRAISGGGEEPGQEPESKTG